MFLFLGFGSLFEHRSAAGPVVLPGACGAGGLGLWLLLSLSLSLAWYKTWNDQAAQMDGEIVLIRAKWSRGPPLAIRTANQLARHPDGHPDGELDGELHLAIHGWWARAPLALSAVDGLHIITIRAIGLALTIKPVADKGHSSTGLCPVRVGN